MIGFLNLPLKQEEKLGKKHWRLTDRQAFFSFVWHPTSYLTREEYYL